MIYKLLLPAMPAYLLAKIPSGKLTASLRKMPIPTRIMLVLIVMLRFAPTVLHEFGEVREAMKIRGFLKSVGNVLKHPMDTLEYAIVPMVFRSLKIADELAASAIVRGIESPYKKESYYVSRIAMLDCFLIVVSVGATVCCCLYRRNGMGKEIMIRDLTFSYGGNGNQLEHISLDIVAGEVIVMTGPSGSGKGSLTRVINGLIPYFYEGELSGDVFVDGKPLKEIPSWERGKIVGNVFQDPRSQFLPMRLPVRLLSAVKTTVIPMRKFGTMYTGRRRTFKIQDILDHSLHSLSYGMRQKVAIASAEAIDPEIYVMDEPSANLDIASTYRFADIIRHLKQQGKTIIIAEHRLYYLMDLADRFLCVQKGKIVREFTAQQMKALTNKEIQALGLRTPDLHQIEQTGNPVCGNQRGCSGSEKAEPLFW